MNFVSIWNTTFLKNACAMNNSKTSNILFSLSVSSLSFKLSYLMTKWKWKLLSHFRLFVTPWTIQSMEFSRPENWSGEPLPSPGDLPNAGMEPRSPTMQADSLPAEPQGSLRILEWIAYPFSNGSFRPRNRTGVSHIAGGLFTNWDIREANK